MTSDSTLRDRRSEPRRYCCAQRIRWTAVAGGNGVHGWLNDVSDSGLGFLTHRFICPAVGDEIEVVCDDEPVVCRVLHVGAADSTFSLVGCRKIKTGPAEVGRPPKPGIFRRRRASRTVLRPVKVDELCPAA
jgi:hypothetical protein